MTIQQIAELYKLPLDERHHQGEDYYRRDGTLRARHISAVIFARDKSGNTIIPEPKRKVLVDDWAGRQKQHEHRDKVVSRSGDSKQRAARNPAARNESGQLTKKGSEEDTKPMKPKTRLRVERKEAMKQAEENDAVRARSACERDRVQSSSRPSQS